MSHFSNKYPHKLDDPWLDYVNCSPAAKQPPTSPGSLAISKVSAAISQTLPQYDPKLGNGKPEISRAKMIQVPGNPALRRYCQLSVLAIFSLLVFVGCSSTPSMQTLERSAGVNASRIGASSTQSTRLAPSTGFPSQNQEWGTAGGDDPLAGVQIPGGPEYVLAPGDVVTVTVWGHPELSGKRIVGADGDIQLPFVGSFKMAGYNADDASSRLSSALRVEYVNAAASVTVDSYNGNQVTVLWTRGSSRSADFPEQSDSARSARHGRRGPVQG